MSRRIKLIIADDHSIVRDGIRTVIEMRTRDMEVVGEAANGKELMALADKVPADVFILDISMPLLNGIEALHRLVKGRPDSKVIMLSMHDDTAFVEKALRCGARGYLLKEDASEEIITAIREILKGRYYLSPSISGFVVQGFLRNTNNQGGKSGDRPLSSREKEILQLIAEGFSSKNIAEQLNLSINTVQTHRKKIMSKLGVHVQADLIRYALKELIVGV